MKVALSTANLSKFERPVPWVPQHGVVTTHVFTDENFPPRINMSPRFQARICKILGWQYLPGHDVYLWVDYQFNLAKPTAAEWLLDQLGDHDMVFFRHPTRSTIREEADYMRERLQISHRIQKRYTGELLDEQMAIIEGTPGYKDETLYAAGIFAMRPYPHVLAMMKEWWYHVSRYHVNDQLQLPYVAWQFGVDVRKLDDDIFAEPHFVWTRGRTRG